VGEIGSVGVFAGRRGFPARGLVSPNPRAVRVLRAKKFDGGTAVQFFGTSLTLLVCVMFYFLFQNVPALFSNNRVLHTPIWPLRHGRVVGSPRGGPFGSTVCGWVKLWPNPLRYIYGWKNSKIGLVVGGCVFQGFWGPPAGPPVTAAVYPAGRAP